MTEGSLSYTASARPGWKQVLSQKQNKQKDRIRIMGARHPHMAPRTTGLAFSLDFRHSNLILFPYLLSLTLCPGNSTRKENSPSPFTLLTNNLFFWHAANRHNRQDSGVKAINACSLCSCEDPLLTAQTCSFLKLPQIYAKRLRKTGSQSIAITFSPSAFMCFRTRFLV